MDTEIIGDVERLGQVTLLLARAIDIGDINRQDSTVMVRRSKTDQETAAAVLYLGPDTLDRIRAWQEAAGVSSRVSGHSLRIGSAQSLP